MNECFAGETEKRNKPGALRPVALFPKCPVQGSVLFIASDNHENFPPNPIFRYRNICTLVTPTVQHRAFAPSPSQIIAYFGHACAVITC